jgi:branched-subunit amino acid aminotransferase/4-amino-4-deoxychorismate lyase
MNVRISPGAAGPSSGPALDDRDASPRHFVFRAGRLVEAAPGPAERLELAACDSWLVDEGAVRAIDRHRARFAAACVDACAPRSVIGGLDAFWAAVLAALPRRGRWFPRVEALGPDAGTLALRIRPAPAPGATVRLWLGDPVDRRLVPRRKGPDLEDLVRRRGRAVVAGADEALLTTGGGLVLEGATTSLLWWEDGRLCLPAPGLRVLPGVTSGLLVERARELGVEVRRRRAPVARLAGREVWAVNALHGIRPVVNWPGEGVPVGPVEQAPGWRDWLHGLAGRLPA